MTTPADDTLTELAASLDRVEQLEQVLWHYILTYRVDDQHPDPYAEAHRIMQEELQHHPWTTTENDQS
jgi:hypothetical protein